MRTLQRIQRAIREQRYRISSHASEEMSEDNLVARDAENVILNGRIMRKFTRDPRGTHYEIAGHTLGGRRARVVCRFFTFGRAVDYHSLRG
jgi:hypothetical protein